MNGNAKKKSLARVWIGNCLFQNIFGHISRIYLKINSTLKKTFNADAC